MKIAILSPFYPFRGGLAQLNARLYTELGKNNEVRAFSFTTLYPKFLFPGKTQFVGEDDFPTIVENERVLSSINPFTYIKTAKRINKFAPDVLIIPYWMSYLAPAFGSVCRFVNKKTKIVSLVHNALPHERNFFDKPFAKYFFRCCDAFVTMSEPVKESLQTLIKDANILLRDHPIYDQYSEPIEQGDAREILNIDKGKKTLLFFGLIREYKGLDILIEAMSSLDDSYQLIIAGECYGDFAKYRALIDKSPFKENIITLDHYIPDDLVTTLFSASDVLVLPYRSATQSGVVGLAYQLETPMIGTNVGALGSTIKNSDTGIVVDCTSLDVAEGIKLFFNQTEKYPIYKENLKKEKIRLSWAKFAEKVESFISSL